MSIGVSKPARITPTEVGASLLRWDDRDHAIGRWDQRTPFDSVSPDLALGESITVDCENIREYFHADGVRVFGQADFEDVWYPYLAIFPIRRGVVRTVLLVEKVVATTIRARLWTVWGDRQ